MDYPETSKGWAEENDDLAVENGNFTNASEDVDMKVSICIYIDSKFNLLYRKKHFMITPLSHTLLSKHLLKLSGTVQRRKQDTTQLGVKILF